MTKQNQREASSSSLPLRKWNHGSRHRYLQITLQIKDNMTCFANPCGIPGLGSDQHRLRLVVMGDSFVGKSAIIKRFLFGRFVGDSSSIHVCDNF